MDCTNFWKEQARAKVISDTHASCSALVDQIIVEETPYVDRSNDSPSATTSTSNASTFQNETNCNSLPPSSTTSFDNGNSNNSSSNESISPWLIHNINVTDLFRTYQQQISPADSTFKIETDLQEILALSDILFLAPNEHNTLKSQVFGLATLHSLCDHVLSDLMKTTDSTEDNQLTDDEFMTITRTIYGVDAKTKSIREAKLDLLSLSARMTGNKAGVVEGIANLLTKLPRNRLLNLDKIGEVELQTTYYDAFLSEIIADQDRNVALRWANKSSSEEETDIRPDAIISTLMQHDFGYPVGFGEVKPGNSSTTKHSVCMDILRLGITSKRAIDKWHLSGCLVFMINVFYISFFVVRKQHKHLYMMTEIGAMTVASSLSELH
ncbi:hypothetical protein G6F51_012711 [Rhizopus arrhizus]|uniref:Uncharacterized protein n=1 Tax=Rhizopus oryzae TaxID=64495 RepID=A0A9P6XW73_RHIOR|nr:hypothetical protein G6F51_012711 [Rhizopus arrhizus]